MRKFYVILILLFFVISCANNKKETHILDFKRFTIEVPKNWKKIKLKGIDSQVGGIISNDNDTMFFDLGMYSWDLDNYEKSIMPRSVWDSLKKNIPIIDSSNYIIVEDYEVDLEIYRTQDTKWDTIDGYLAKMIFPIHTGKGLSGIYIDSLNSDKIRFNLYGIDLKPKNEKLFLEAIQTIKFNMKD